MAVAVAVWNPIVMELGLFVLDDAIQDERESILGIMNAHT